MRTRRRFGKRLRKTEVPRIQTRRKFRRRKSRVRKHKELVKIPSSGLTRIEFNAKNHSITPSNLTKDTMIVAILHSPTCPHCTVLMESEVEGQPTKWKEMEDIIAKTAMEGSCPYKDIKTMDMPSTNPEFIEEFNRRYGDSLLEQPLDAPAYPYIVRIHGGKTDKYEGDRAPAIMANWFLS